MKLQQKLAWMELSKHWSCNENWGDLLGIPFWTNGRTDESQFTTKIFKKQKSKMSQWRFEQSLSLTKYIFWTPDLKITECDTEITSNTQYSHLNNKQNNFYVTLLRFTEFHFISGFHQIIKSMRRSWKIKSQVMWSINIYNNDDFQCCHWCLHTELGSAWRSEGIVIPQCCTVGFQSEAVKKKVGKPVEV